MCIRDSLNPALMSHRYEPHHAEMMGGNLFHLTHLAKCGAIWDTGIAPWTRVGAMFTPYSHEDPRSEDTQRSTAADRDCMICVDGTSVAYELNKEGRGGVYIDLTGTVTVKSDSICLKTFCKSISIFDPRQRKVVCNLFSSKYKNLHVLSCLLYTSPSPRDRTRSRMPSSA